MARGRKPKPKPLEEFENVFLPEQVEEKVEVVAKPKKAKEQPKSKGDGEHNRYAKFK
jgi:hypothetical protein